MGDYDELRSIDLSEARKLMRGRKEGGPSLQVLRRYANPRRGCRPRGPAGPVVVLRVVRVAGRMRTMPEWVEAFVRERAALAGAPPAQAPTSHSRKASIRAADEVLRRNGLL